jgi:hypothetical protein
LIAYILIGMAAKEAVVAGAVLAPLSAGARSQEDGTRGFEAANVATLTSWKAAHIAAFALTRRAVYEVGWAQVGAHDAGDGRRGFEAWGGDVADILDAAAVEAVAGAGAPGAVLSASTLLVQVWEAFA